MQIPHFVWDDNSWMALAQPMYVKNRVSDRKPMRTTIDIDDYLMRKSDAPQRPNTEKAVVEAALRLLIQTYSQHRRRT